MSENVRSRWIERTKNRLSWPRLQISLILTFTALCAFLTSVLLLRIDVTSMAVRYPIAIAAAYVVFLGLLRVWLWMRNRSLDLDVPFDLPVNVAAPDTSVGDSVFNFGGGGDFAGAGAGGGWDGDAPMPTAAAFVSSPSGSSSSGSGGLDIGLDLDLDELWLVALAVVVAIGGLLAIFYIVYAAPVLLAEITVDSLLAAGLYKTASSIEPRYWLSTAIRKTAIPVLLAMALFGASGYLLQAAVPEARTVGEVIRSLGQ